MFFTVVLCSEFFGQLGGINSATGGWYYGAWTGFVQRWAGACRYHRLHKMGDGKHLSNSWEIHICWPWSEIRSPLHSASWLWKCDYGGKFHGSLECSWSVDSMSVFISYSLLMCSALSDHACKFVQNLFGQWLQRNRRWISELCWLLISDVWRVTLTTMKLVGIEREDFGIQNCQCYIELSGWYSLTIDTVYQIARNVLHNTRAATLQARERSHPLRRKRRWRWCSWQKQAQTGRGRLFNTCSCLMNSSSSFHSTLLSWSHMFRHSFECIVL